MDRCLNSRHGFTLFELVMAIVIGAVVLLSAADLLINFTQYTTNLVKSEASLMESSLGAFEEMVYNISRANKTALGCESTITTSFPSGCTSTNCIQIRTDTDAITKTPSDYSDDVIYTYYINTTLNDKFLYRAIGNSTSATATALPTKIASNIATLTFTRPSGIPQHEIFIVLEGQTQSGATGGVVKEHLETTVVSRVRSTN